MGDRFGGFLPDWLGFSAAGPAGGSGSAGPATGGNELTQDPYDTTKDTEPYATKYPGSSFGQRLRRLAGPEARQPGTPGYNHMQNAYILQERGKHGALTFDPNDPTRGGYTVNHGQNAYGSQADPYSAIHYANPESAQLAQSYNTYNQGRLASLAGLKGPQRQQANQRYKHRTPWNPDAPAA